MRSRAFVAVMAVAFAVAAPALAAKLKGQPRIDGDPVVGSQLRAVADWKGGPSTTVSYSWERCPSGGDDDDDDDELDCDRISGANGATYTPMTADRGFRIRVEVEVDEPNEKPDSDVSDPTEEVRAAPPPSPTPTPSLPPSPHPSPGPSASGASAPVRTPTATTSPSAIVPARPRYLRPFPVVRIKGQLSDGGAIVAMLRVTAPRKSKVRVVCTGASCPVEQLARGPGRIRPFERFLAAGTRIGIRVTRPALVGKHVRITIREDRRPARRDACVLPGSARAVPCPEP